MKFTLQIYIAVFCMLMTMSMQTSAQSKITRVEPPNWWVGLNNPTLQLMVQGDQISLTEVKIDYPGIKLVKVNKADHADFLFLDLEIAPTAEAGTFNIDFYVKKKKKATFAYTLNKRDERADPVIDQSDVLYLITPDRFANGDPSTDEVKSMKEGIDLDFHSGRHGGDLKGISDHLDYLDDLGVTALWLNPILENNMPEYSYHGYAITDYYQVDPRYGSNESYKKLTADLHDRDMKMVMDFVLNHCGLEHWWMKDMPFKDWINYYPEYVNTNHAMASLSDPHAAESDREQMEKGWFVQSMPDLNQRNPFMSIYLIQNAIWWIEYLALDGIRIDTYPYNNTDFSKRWTERIYEEYPNFFLVGETWVDNEAMEAYWAKKDPAQTDAFDSGLSAITDFPLCFSIHNALKDEDGDLKKVYDVLSKDFLYYDPTTNMTFLDNHDMDRFYHTIGEDLGKFKMASTLLLTTRGIPQFYYGTEILMRKFGEHGVLREKFPGGWAGDTRDAFTAAGRTKEENEAFDHYQKLLNWRKTSAAISQGTLKHFVPYENVYVYARQSADETVLVILNNNAEASTLDMKRFAEVLGGSTSAKEVLTGQLVIDLTSMELAPYASKVLVLDAPKTPKN